MDLKRSLVLSSALLLLATSIARGQLAVTSADVVSREVTVLVRDSRRRVVAVSREITVATGPSVAVDRRTVVSRELSVGVPRSDLAAVSLNAPESGVAGQPFEVRWEVESTAPGEARGPWVDRITLVPDGGGNETILAEVEHSAFAAGADPCDDAACRAYEKRETFTLPSEAGAYRIRLEVDANGVVDEDDETNNILESTVRVRAAFLADLEVTSVIPPGAGVLAGSTIEVNFVVTNTGEWPTEVPFWQDSVFLTAANDELAVFLADEPFFLGEFQNATFLPPGESYPQTVPVTLPDDIEGTFFLAVYADSHRRSNAQWRRGATFDIPELDEDNVRFSAPFSIVAPPQPDLAVTQISFASPAFSNTRFEVTWTVENSGEADTDSGNWVDAVYLSSDRDPVIRSDDLLLGSVRRAGPPLAPGERDATGGFAGRLPADLRGQFFVKVFTDSGGRNSEFRGEDNNVGVSSERDACVQLCQQDPASDACRGCGQLEVVLSPAVDLQPVSVRVTPETGIPGHRLEVSWTVASINAPFNAGAAWRDAIYLSRDDRFDPGLDQLLGVRSAGTSLLSGDAPPLYSATAEVLLPAVTAAGPHFVLLVVDATSGIFEGFTEAPGDQSRNENNNIASVPLLVEAVPTDLVPEINCGDCVTLPAASAALDELTLGWRVTNSGAEGTPVSQWRDRVYLSADELVDASDVLLAEVTRSAETPLAAGASYVVRQASTVPAVSPGDYFLLFKTDARDDVFEAVSGETNNLISAPFSVTANGPDLVVADVTFNDRAASGQPVQIAWRVTNEGNRPTRALSREDRVYLSADDTLDREDLLFGSRVHDGILAAGESAPVSASFVLPLDLSGCFNVIVQADASDEIFERNEVNNQRAEMMLLGIELSPLANLVVTDIDADARGVSGQTLTVEWTVRNFGPGPTNASVWCDSVYLSRDDYLDRKRDLFLGFRDHVGFLLEGESYPARATLDLPLGVSGPYFAFVVTDSSEKVVERDEGDNTTRDAGGSDIDLPPLTNLIVTAVEPPGSGTLGDVARIEWQLEVTTADATGRWFDSLFLSADATWDLGDAFLGRFEVDPGALAPGAPFTAVGEARIPGVLPGEYHVIARADVANQIPETNEEDNEASSVGTLTLTAIALDLEPASGEGLTESSLDAGQDRYFEMRVPPEIAGKTLRVRLDHDSPQAWTELYIGLERVPSPGQFDFRFSRPTAPEQEITIPAVAEGSYFILAKALASAGALVPNTARLSASVVPFAVEAATPTTIGDQGRVTVEVTGSQFLPGAHLELTATGSGSILPAEWTRVLDSTRLAAKLVLDPATVTRGAYRLAVVNPDGERRELPEDIAVEAVIPPALDVLPADPPPLREGSAGNVECVVTNRGNVDAEYVFLLHTLEDLDDREVLEGSAPPPLTSSVVADGFVTRSSVVSSLGPSESAVLTSTVRAAVGSEGDIALGQGAAVFTTQEFLAFQETAADAARRTILEGVVEAEESGRQQTLQDVQDTAVWRGVWFDRLVFAGVVDPEDVTDFLAGADLVVAPKPPAREDCFPGSTAGPRPSFCASLSDRLCDGWLRHAIDLGADALGVFAPKTAIGSFAIDRLDPVSRAGCVSGASLCASCISWSVLRSVDPNEKSGTDGFGDERFVPLSRPVPYRVYFQNLPDATGPAATVAITDPLDPSLSSGSVRLGDIAFADRIIDVPENSLTFQTRLDLTESRGVLLDVTAGVDATRGQIFWTLRSIDPETGQVPTDATLGFLPPDDDEGVGSGWVEYGAVPLRNIAARTVLENDARIVFDVNQPLDTGRILNTVDTEPPRSQIAPLALTQSDPSFALSWSGEDPDGGSGVAAFTIYVSENNGPFSALLSNTTRTGFPFTGTPGRRYAFYSVATDNAGNVEAPPAEPQTVTDISLDVGIRFRRGDANSDATVDVSDSIFTLIWLFAGGPAPSCLDAADVNDDGGVDIADPTYGLASLFAGGPTIPPPGPLGCGTDPTEDDLEPCGGQEELCAR